MHFFTEPDLLSTNTQYFGPEVDLWSSSDPNEFQGYFFHNNIFNVTTIFELTEQAKVFACQDSMMIVQEYIDSGTGLVNNDLVNIVLKPTKGLDIPYTPIKYYIYRGILKSSFISGSSITPDVPASKTEFITKFWKSWIDYKIFMGTPTTPAVFPDPTPKSFGYGTLPNTTLVEEIFNSSESNNNIINDFQAIEVKEGEWIGNFGVGEIGFEIITDTDDFLVNLDYVKKSNHIIDVTALASITPVTPISNFNLRTRREQVLNFIDPVAFFGMHHDIGVDLFSSYDSTSIKRTTTTKKNLELYNEVLTKFVNHDTVYFDIRNEKGFSYNFYDNYKDAENVNFIIGRPTGITSLPNIYLKYKMGLDMFPIVICKPVIDGILPLVSDKEVIDLFFRFDDNLEPLIFAENSKLLASNGKTNFIEKGDLIDTLTPGWTKNIRIKAPTVTVGGAKVNLPYFFKLQYFRQKENVASPNTVLKNNNYLDAVFGGININTFSVPTVFNHVRNTKRGFIKGSNFDYVSETGLYFDDNRVLLYANNSFSHKESKNVYPKIDLTAFKFKSIVHSAVVYKEILFNKWQINDSASTTIDILEIVGYNKDTKRATNTENVYLLGITKIEFDSLRNNTGISNLHQRYIAFEEVGNQQDVVNGTPYKKYKLKLQGLNDSGEVVFITPTTDVFVYGSTLNMLCSKDFAAAAVLENLLPDPGTFEEFPLVEVWKYDKADSYVLSKFPTGEVTVSDRGNVTVIQKVEPKANVYFPVDASGDLLPSTKKPNYPLIVIIHGNGHLYESYDKICTHFAKNGFIAASISCLFKKNEIELRSITPAYSPSSGVSYDYVFNSEAGIYLYESGPKKFSKYEVVSSTVTITPMSWIEGIGKDFEIITNTAGNLQANFKTLSFNLQDMNITGRSNLLYPHLKIIKEKFDTKVQNNIGLIGHSRGGEAVVRAAKDIVLLSASQVPVDLRDINAIISLAPTDLWDEENLIQDVPYFVLYGSKDGDVSGDIDDTILYPFRQNGEVGIVGTGGFSLYDRAKNQSEKAMTFVYGATHNGFITDNHDYSPLFPSLETEIIQSKITFAYMNAFFRKHLKQENIWNSVIKGDHIPLSIQKKDIYHQYKNMNTSQIKEIQIFDGISSIPSQISTSGGVTIRLTEFDRRVTSSVTYVDPVSGSTLTTTKPVSGIYPYIYTTNNIKRIDKYSPHAKKGLYVDYTAAGEIYFNQITSGLDISNYNFISFRISQVVLPVTGTYNNLSLIEVSLKDTSNVSNQTKLKKTIPAPDLRGPTKGYLSSGDPDKESITKSALLTVRIPLSEFVSVDLIHIKQVSFIIPSIGSGAFILDDLEFTI